MIKVDRPPQPEIKLYTDRKYNLTKKERTFLLATIEEDSFNFAHFVPRLKDKQERFTKAEQETLKAICHYANPEHFKDNLRLTSKKGPTFNAYKDKDLKIILRDTFKKKCAYCESLFLSVSPADIEHFRPKSAINRFINNQDDDLIYPGYYWLAADWDNLLWSCISCNRKSNLETPNADEAQALGKQNRFPVADENNRIRSHDQDLSPEHNNKLILDPCRDEPQEHLVFPLEEDLGIVKSAILRDGKPSPKGEASIPVYGLNRVELVFTRREEALDLKAIFIGMLRSMEAFISKKEANEDASREEAEFTSQKERFNAKLSPSAVYLGLKRVLITEFDEFDLLKRFNLKVEDLLNLH